MLERRKILLETSLISKGEGFEEERDFLDSHCSVHRSIIEFLENAVTGGSDAEKELNDLDDIEMGLTKETEN
jgi:hypothetical protein